MKLWVLAWLVLLVPFVVSAELREGIHNGGFELGRDRMENRPADWNVGFPGDAPPVGGWALIPDPMGGTALELRSDTDEGYLVSQIVDLPAATMAGTEVVLSAIVDIPEAAAWVAVQFAALNPEAPIDPAVGFSHVGHLLLTTATRGRQELSGSVTLTGPAEFLAVVLMVVGDDAVAVFDDVSVTADVPRPDCGPSFLATNLPSSGVPSFPIGLTNENPRNQSDHARRELSARLAEGADIINLFVHIRWNALTGLPLLNGHERIVLSAQEARRNTLPRMLTFDFTHADLDGLGDVNPLPDGAPVGRLDDPGVSEAYVEEIVALATVTGASIVSVGIETDYFLLAHPDQWPAFRTMLCTAHDRLRSLDPEIHVTTYFTLETLIHPDLSPNIDGQAAFRELAPCFDSVGYSYYPADGIHHLEDIVPGMFAAASEVAPGMPLIIPEFGFPSGGIYTEGEQADFLRRAMEELAGHEVTAMIIYSLYDQTYFGAPQYFQDAFKSIGARHLDGASKEVWQMLRHIRWLRDAPIPPAISPKDVCVTEPRNGDSRERH